MKLRENNEDIAEQHLHTHLSENKEKLLLHIARHGPRPHNGALFSLKNDFTVIDCFDKNEFEWYIGWLGEEKLAFKAGAGPDTVNLTLTMDE